MNDRLRSLIGYVFRLLNFGWTAALLLATLALVVSVPFWVLYRVVAPLFGPDPIGYLREVVTGIGAIVLIAMMITALIVSGMALFSKFQLVRSIAKGVVAIFLALVVLVSLTHCFSSSKSCTANRYVDCP